MTEEVIREMEAKIPVLTKAVSEYSKLVSELESVQSDIRAADSEAATVGDEFSKNYMGSRVDIHVSVGSIKAGTNSALNTINALISEIESYIGKIDRLLSQYQMMIDQARQSAE